MKNQSAPPRQANTRPIAFRHRSQMLRVLKIFLPLLAVAILSSLFLFSRGITIDGTLPFANFDLADRLREPKMTEVRLATTTQKGSLVDLSADAVVPKTASQTLARNAKGTITPTQGDATTFTAPQVLYNEQTARANLSGGVHVITGAYTMVTEAMDVDLAAGRLQSRSQVNAQGPLGTLQAGGMIVQENEGSLYLYFNSGVQLVYLPQ